MADENDVQFINNEVHGRNFHFHFDNQSFGQFLFNQTDKYASNVYQINFNTGATETYLSVQKKAIRVALHIDQMGITSEDVILLCTYNTMDSTLPLFAGQYLGAKIASIDPTQSIRDCAYLVDLVQPKLIFFCSDAIDLLEGMLKLAKSKPLMVLFESDNDNYLKFADFLAEKRDEDLFKPKQVQDLHETAFIYFSSGTTGMPKGVTISHHAILHATEGLRRMNVVFDCTMHTSTFYWVSALITLTASMMTGGRRVVFQNCNPQSYIEICSKLDVTFCFMASNYAYMFEEEHFNYKTSPSLTITLGGSGVNAMTIRKLQNWLRNGNIQLCYGMTEIAGYASLLDPVLDKDFRTSDEITTSGKPIPGRVIKIVNIATGQKLGPYQRGEIRIQSPATTRGYYKQASSADDIMDKDGWIKTGDIGYFDDHYCFFVVDRIKEMFKYMTWHIVPAVLELVIQEHPSVLECVVFGVPNAFQEHVPTAMVVLKENAFKVTAAEIVSFVDGKVDDRQRLRGGIKFVQNIPKTPSGKIKRKDALSLFWSS